MGKIRVYEYAKELNMSSKEILGILKRLNIPVKGHMSIVEEEAQAKINQFFQDVKRRANEEKMRRLAESKASQEKHAHETEEKRTERKPHIPKEEPIGQEQKEGPHTDSHPVPPQGSLRETEMRDRSGGREATQAGKGSGERDVQSQGHPSQTERMDRPRQEAGRPSGERQRSDQNGSRPNGDRNLPRQEGGRAAGDRGDRPRQEAGRPYGDRGDRPRQEGSRPYGGDRGDRPRQEAGRPYGDRGDRPRQEAGRPYGDRGDRPRQEGSRPYGDRGDRPRQEVSRPYGDRGDRPRQEGNRPYGGDRGDRPRQEVSRPYGDRGDRPRQEGSRPYGGDRGDRPRQEAGRPYGDRGDRPRQEAGRPYGDRGDRPRQEGSRPYGDRGDRPRQEGSRPYGDHRAYPPKGDKEGYDKDRRGGGRGERKDRLTIPPAPQPEEKTEQPRRRVQKKKEFVSAEETKKVLKKTGKIKTLAPPLDFDDERGEVVRGKKRNKNKKNKDIIFGEDKETPTKLVLGDSINVGEFAKRMGKEPGEVMKKLVLLNVFATINQEIDFDVASLVAGEYGIEVEKKVIINEDEFETIEEHDDPSQLTERPPVVTIMGHVDHGKTTLLDSIRHTRVTATEEGGITQHIGAYQVEINGKRITFLDTPGHEAFTAMRARGAKVTDITILVVAADDGVMPQTVEAINHAKAANVPIIVAVNKVDKPDANPDRVKQELSEYGLLPEDWGGDTIFVHVSALKGDGIRDLLEMVLLVAEVQELKANPHKRARGTVIEAELDKGKGPVATVLVQSGTLRIGDPVVVGTAYGHVRSMINDLGRRIKEAPPSTPVAITGLDNVPEAGDQFMVFEEDSKAKEIASHRALKKREIELKKNQVSLDDLFSQIKEGEVKDLNLIIKGDVQGSVEALKGSIEKIHVEGVRVRIIHTGVGAVNESDVTLAAASNAIIIGFNVRPVANAKVMAEHEKVEIRLHSIIYKVTEEIEKALKGMLDPVYEEKVIGQVEVRQTFKVSKVGTIAGCYVTEGKVTRDAGVRVIRDGIVIFEGKLDSLKRFKDDAKEVAQGYECGLTVKNFNDVKEGDVIEAFIMETVKQ